MTLDQQFIAKLTPTSIMKTFADLLERKTDLLDGNIRIAKGSDGIDHLTFKKNINKHTGIICSKGIAGKYIFAPFREVIVPKPPYEKDQLKQAKEAGKIRILSVSTIQDTIFQELMSQVLTLYAERKFINSIDMHSFAYRKNKSSKMAVQLIIEYIEQGYVHILDGDIEKFFDKIEHENLKRKTELFFGTENPVLLRQLYRFMNVSRIPDGIYYEYRSTGLGAEKRLLGIPQGGVLSGLLANIYLYDFDLYVINMLQAKYNFKYIRYADDFVLMFKSPAYIPEIFELLRIFLENEKLKLYPVDEKSKILDLSRNKCETLEFLGFDISPKFLRVKKANIKKFLHRIETVIKGISADDIERYLLAVANRTKPKVIGLEELLSENGFCQECENLLPKRNWIGYFMMIDDVRMLRNIDTRIRKLIYEDYHFKTKLHLKKKDLLNFGSQLLSLEKTYYLYKKQERLVLTGKLSYCKCSRHFDPKLNSIVIVPAAKTSDIS